MTKNKFLLLNIVTMGCEDSHPVVEDPETLPSMPPSPKQVRQNSNSEVNQNENSNQPSETNAEENEGSQEKIQE